MMVVIDVGSSIHSKTPVEFLCLEMGCIPLKYIIKSRRIMYLHYLLNRNENDMIWQFLNAQMKNPKNNDWYIDVKNDLDYFNIDLSCDQLKSMTKESLSKMVKEQSRKKALEDLLMVKNKHSKLDNIEYKKLEMQPYLKSKLFYRDDARLLFRLRSNM